MFRMCASLCYLLNIRVWTVDTKPLVKYKCKTWGVISQEELEDMEFLDEDYDPSLSRSERRKMRKKRLEEKLKAVKAEETTLSSHLDKQRQEVRLEFPYSRHTI